MTQVSNSVEKNIGPFSYTLDEFKFWHRFRVAKWELAIRLDRENSHPRFPPVESIRSTLAQALATGLEGAKMGTELRKQGVPLSERVAAGYKLGQERGQHHVANPVTRDDFLSGVNATLNHDTYRGSSVTLETTWWNKR